MFLYIMQICFAIYEPILMIVELGGKKHHFKQSNLLWIDQSLIHLLRELYRSMRVHRHWMMHSVTSHTVVDILRLIFYKWNTRWRLVCAHLAIIITFRSNVALNVAKTHHKNDVCVWRVLSSAETSRLDSVAFYFSILRKYSFLICLSSHFILYFKTETVAFSSIKSVIFPPKTRGLTFRS